MLVPILEVKNEEMPEELKRASNDLLKNATRSMTSWAEKNHKQKLIDNLYRMGYYKQNQTIYLTLNNPTKEE